MNIVALFKETYLNWGKNDPWAKSAIIAYYTLFSLPSLLMITVYVAGLFFGREAVQGSVTKEISGIVGPESARAVETMIANAALENTSALTIIIGVGMLVFAATGVFFQLQKSLNDVWNVRAKHTGIKQILKRRATSFGMVLIIGLLLLVSLLISATISLLSEFLGAQYSQVSSLLIETVNFFVSQLFITALFAAIFTVLPDVSIKWRTTLIGASFTALLFLAGKYVLSFYFAQSDPVSVYGAAGSVVLIMLWVYYTCLILFFGAEFTVQWALFRNLKIEPTSNAVYSYEKELEELRAYKERIEEERLEKHNHETR
ncbi:MAG: ribonuclease BN [Flavobacteriaceae bacterium]|nr:ribonuclease BN [Flavobacteriaceae bacterium]